MCPRHVGGRYPTPGLRKRGLSALSCLSLHADHLAQRVYHVHQIALRFHHRVNGLVRHRSFVDHITPPCQSEPILSKVSSTDKELFRIPGGQPEKWHPWSVGLASHRCEATYSCWARSRP